MKYSVSERSTCRLCSSDRLVPFLELSDMPLTDDLLHEEELNKEFLWPVRVFLCEYCNMVQTLHDVDVRDYYRQYQYSVAISPLAQHFMQRLAERVWQGYQFRPGDAVVEVGSSDGTQLACFQAIGAKVFGFEPSVHLAQVARSRGVPVAQRLFDNQADQEIPTNLLPVQVMLLTYTFDHLPDPVNFLMTVRRVLDRKRGVLVIEVHDLEKIIERREFCLFEHEHTTYYTVATIQTVLRQAGFEVVSASLVPETERRSDSLLVIATIEGSTFAGQALPTLSVGLLRNAEAYIAFGHGVENNVSRLKGLLRNKRKKGLLLAGYGAGGRGVMTLAATVQPGDFTYLCDKNSTIHGYYTPKSHVRIVGPHHILNEPVDEIIVFSFGYMEEIVQDLTEYTARRGQLISLLELL